MDKNKRLTVWLPVIIAASIALGRELKKTRKEEQRDNT